MGFPFTFRLPVDGLGKDLAARKAVGQGPGGRDAYVEVDVTHPDNEVGQVLFSQPLDELPGVLTEILAVSIALDYLHIHNNSSSNRVVQIKTGDGKWFMDTVIPAKGLYSPRVGGIPLIGGISWGADGPDVYGGFTGYKATD